MAGFNPFSSIPVPRKGRTNFNLSHSVDGTFPLSTVVPVLCTDTIPGDAFKINSYNITKFQTLLAPAMQRIDASLLWFKVPQRLLFKHYKDWYSGGADGNPDVEKPHVFLNRVISDLQIFCNRNWETFGAPSAGEFCLDFTYTFFGPGSLWNYLGLPTPIEYNGTSWVVLSLDDMVTGDNNDPSYVDIMPIMAYQFIYDCYFRDQTLSDPKFKNSEDGNFRINDDHPLIFTSLYSGTEYNLGDQTSGEDLSEGGEVSTMDLLYLLLPFNRAWQKDYFTSAQPTAQRGPEVTLDMFQNQKVPVGVTGSGELLFRAENMAADDEVNRGTNIFTTDAIEGTQTTGIGVEDVNEQSHQLALAGMTGVTADLSGLSPITIAAFRNLFKLQAFLEKNQVAGGRYIESILAHWAERVPDFTVQRPQFIRATRLPVQISPVTATANTLGLNSVVGDQAGRAYTEGNIGSVRIYTQEPSYIFALYCVTAPPSYASQGLARMWQRRTRFDLPWTEFQHIGEQAIKCRELYYDFAGDPDENNDKDFGYQQRYSEFKYMPDRKVGDFMTSMSYWHMARLFNETPALNADFVTQHLDPRIFAVQEQRPIQASFFFEITAKHKLSKYSTPKLT